MTADVIRRAASRHRLDHSRGVHQDRGVHCLRRNGLRVLRPALAAAL